jgi:hypothetical protein
MTDKYYFFDSVKIFTHYKLNTDIVPVDLDTVLDLRPEKSGKVALHYTIPNSVISDEFNKLLAMGGMVVDHAEVFYRPGIGVLNDAFIHTDGHIVRTGFAKINYVVGGENNLMKWYRPRVVTEELITTVGTKYLRFAPEDCELIDQLDMQGLYIVNAAIPHSVEMTTGSTVEPRICISITPKNKWGKHSTAGCIDTKYRLTHALSKLEKASSTAS